MASQHPSITLPSAVDAFGLVELLRAQSADFSAWLGLGMPPAKALRRSGLAFWRAGELAPAAETLRHALALNETDPEAWRDLSFLYHGLAKIAESEAAIKKSLDLMPGHSGAWVHLANLRQQDGRPGDAEEAFREALALDPGLDDAELGLGVLLYARLELVEAEARLRAVADRNPDPSIADWALGHIYYLTGRFAESIAAFDRAARCLTLDAQSREKRARAQAFVEMLADDIEAGLRNYACLSPQPAADDDVLRDAFLQFSALGHAQAARAIALERLRSNPGDVEQAYLLEVAAGNGPTQAPAAYIEAHFDRFASTFDQKLINVLRYDGPAILRRLIEKKRSSFHDILDLGCGTGLAAPHLAKIGGYCVGVDLSSNMLAEARKYGVYDELIHSEVVAFMRTSPQTFDLVLAADVLVYFGDINAFCAAVKARLKPCGLFAFSVELADGEGYRALPSGRFSHSRSYLADILAGRFTVLAEEAAPVRNEAGRPVPGLFVVAQVVETGR